MPGSKISGARRALTKLEAMLPRPARVFEQRLFGGLTVDEVSEAMGVSPKTVQRDWETARAWLRKEVGHHLAIADFVRHAHAAGDRI